MTPELKLSIFPPAQRAVWDRLQNHAAALTERGYYLAGGTALALQIGHRQSIDFDFFTPQQRLGKITAEWLQQLPGVTLREMDEHTVHAEIEQVKVSFIGAYKYQLVQKPIQPNGIAIASLLDIGVMKLLAITHRATVRDYLDLAAIIGGRIPLSQLLEASRQKYGATFNTMIPLRALTAFKDLDQEMPPVFDATLAKEWQRILRQAVKDSAL